MRTPRRWFGRNVKTGGAGSWAATPQCTFRTAMGTLWDSYAQPSGAKGIAIYTHAYAKTDLSGICL